MDASQSSLGTAQPPRCEACQISFSRQDDLNRHLTETKAHASALQCPFPGCQIAYQRHSKTKAHFWDEHRHELGGLPISISTNSAENAPIVLLVQNANRQRADVEATQAQLSGGFGFPSEHIEAGFQHNLMVDSTGTPSDTEIGAYGISHEETQASNLPHGQQGFSVSSESGGGMSAGVWLPPFVPDNLPNSSIFLEPGAAPLNSQFPASMRHPSSSYTHPPMYGSPAHSFAPSPTNQDTVAVEEGTYPSYEYPNQNMGYGEHSFSDPDAGNTNGQQIMDYAESFFSGPDAGDANGQQNMGLC